MEEWDWWEKAGMIAIWVAMLLGAFWRMSH